MSSWWDPCLPCPRLEPRGSQGYRPGLLSSCQLQNSPKAWHSGLGRQQLTLADLLVLPVGHSECECVEAGWGVAQLPRSCCHQCCMKLGSTGWNSKRAAYRSPAIVCKIVPMCVVAQASTRFSSVMVQWRAFAPTLTGVAAGIRWCCCRV